MPRAGLALPSCPCRSPVGSGLGAQPGSGPAELHQRCSCCPKALWSLSSSFCLSLPGKNPLPSTPLTFSCPPLQHCRLRALLSPGHFLSMLLHDSLIPEAGRFPDFSRKRSFHSGCFCNRLSPLLLPQDSGPPGMKRISALACQKES